MSSAIDISAQFGGGDAADAVLPHFHALKRAAKLVQLQNFPYPQLAFILRVSGEITSFDGCGLDNLDIQQGEYLSLDIVLSVRDRAALKPDWHNPIAAAILEVPSFLSASDDRRLPSHDISGLVNCTQAFAEHYLAQVGSL